MRIVGVDLENVKSYERQSVRFAPGTNAICGLNGAGKSTIVEAIGFALFDALPTTQEQFVREGEKTATVTVHVEDEDGRPYEVWRRCGSTSQYFVYDAELDEKLTDGKGDTMGWLREFTGVEQRGDLTALFLDAVGVPQGLLTAAFLETASRRKDIFNPLLRVDEYEDVWRALREPAGCLRDDIAEEKQRIAGFEGEVKRLPAERERANELGAAIAKDEASQERVQTDLDQVSERKDQMAETKERLERLERALTAAEGDARTAKVQWEEAQEALRRAEEAQEVVAASEAGHRAYVAAEKALEGLEAKRDERDRVKEARQAADKALAVAQQEIAALERSLEEIAAAEEDVEALRPKAEQQEALEAKLEEARRDADRLEDRRRALERRREDVSHLDKRLARVDEGLEESGEIEEALEGLREALSENEAARETLVSRIAACEAQLARVGEQTETLRSAEEATCPICEGPLTPDHRAELLARNEALAAELESTLATLETEQEGLQATRDDLRAKLDAHQERLKALPRVEEREELAEQVAKGREAIQALDEEIAKLADAAERVAESQEALEALGDPRHAYQRALDVAGRRGNVEQDLGEAEARVIELTSELGALEARLAEFADLDERIEAERKERERHAPDHERYVAHIREAEALETRQTRVVEQKEAWDAAEAERERVVAERDGVAEIYDAEAHEEVRARYDALRGELATLKEALRHRHRQLEETEKTIAHLTKVEEELKAARDRREELEGLLSLLEVVRQVVRDAGPKVTRALVQVISLQAERLYAEIMADHRARLAWTEDYEIVLKSEGRERGFQQLSGGEQMAAALAVRLALLKEVSAVDLAFFDEPTANLDDRRRDNLAQQILNVKGFSQLFVISHDDTFEQDTDHVLRVVKEDGRSRTISE